MSFFIFKNIGNKFLIFVFILKKFTKVNNLFLKNYLDTKNF